MLTSAKLAPVVDYDRLLEFWRAADGLGYHAVWNYDHFFGLGTDATSLAQPTLEGWTTLAAMAVEVKRARVGCMVTGVTYRHPAVLANMAVTVDHISGGRLEFGIGAAWHQPEHDALGMPFPSPGERVAMLRDAVKLMKTYWTNDVSSYDGTHFTLRDAYCSPRPVQSPHPPVVIGGTKPKMLKLVAELADEWNTVSGDPEHFSALNKQLDEACAEVGRDPATLRRGVQLFIHPAVEGQPEEQEAQIPRYRDAGAEHVVLSFYQPPSIDLLERLAPA